MRWLLEFYHERRGVLARYSVAAPLPAVAALLGREALLAEHPSPPRRTRPGLFEQAARVGGRDPSGWRLYRIVQDTQPGSASVIPTTAS